MLIESDVYLQSVLSGLVVSIGGLTESLVKHVLCLLRQCMLAAGQIKAFFACLLIADCEVHHVEPKLHTARSLLRARVHTAP